MKTHSGENLTRRRLLKGVGIGAGLAAGAGLLGYQTMRSAPFGAQAQGQRLARMQASANYRDGAFHNLEPVTVINPRRSRLETLLGFLTEDESGQKPKAPLPTVRTDLSSLPDGAILWFGHSGYLLRIAGQTVLIDPALSQAFPFPGFFRPFAGTDIFRAQDLPDCDVLLITHDHYDHLDYATVSAMRHRVRRVICPLGVGAHLVRWGYEEQQIVELDWFEQQGLGPLRLTALPTQHFSGRTFRRNTTLWAGYMIEAAGFRLYVSGDGGYGSHFSRIRDAFGPIDLAIVENGQYNEDWAGIHLLPADGEKAVRDLSPRYLMSCHNCRYDISRHLWNEPLQAAEAYAARLGVPLVSPMIGQPVRLDDLDARCRPWWKALV